MKTEMQDTSEDAFKDVKNHKAAKRCIAVYGVIKRNVSCSNSMIMRELRLSANQVSGRTYDLRNYFKVVGYDKKGYCPIALERGVKRLVCFWKVVRDFDLWDKYKEVEDEGL